MLGNRNKIQQYLRRNRNFSTGFQENKVNALESQLLLMATAINTDSTSMCHALTVVCTLIYLILKVTPTQALLLSLIYM